MTAELSEGRQYLHPGGPTGVPRLLYPARTWEKKPVDQDTRPPQTLTLRRLGLRLPAPRAVRSDCTVFWRRAWTGTPGMGSYLVGCALGSYLDPPSCPSHCELLQKPVLVVPMRVFLNPPEPRPQPGAWCFSFLDPPALTM